MFDVATMPPPSSSDFEAIVYSSFQSTKTETSKSFDKEEIGQNYRSIN
jgi:hypothetical protein